MYENNENIIVPQHTGPVPRVRSEGLNVTQGKHFVCIHSDYKNDIASLLPILSAAHVAHHASQALLQRLNSKFQCLNLKNHTLRCMHVQHTVTFTRSYLTQEEWDWDCEFRAVVFPDERAAGAVGNRDGVRTLHVTLLSAGTRASLRQCVDCCGSSSPEESCSARGEFV